MGGGGGGNGVKTEACNFIENSVSDGQTVETFECWCDVNMWRCTDYQTGCTILVSKSEVFIEVFIENISKISFLPFQKVGKACFSRVKRLTLPSP